MKFLSSLLLLASIVVLSNCIDFIDDPILGRMERSEKYPSLLQMQGRPDVVFLPTESQIRAFGLERTSRRTKRQFSFGDEDEEEERKARQREEAVFQNFVTETFGTKSSIRRFNPPALSIPGIEITNSQDEKYVQIFTIEKRNFNDAFFNHFKRKMQTQRSDKPWMTDPEDVYAILRRNGFRYCVEKETSTKLEQARPYNKKTLLAKISCDGSDPEKLVVAFAVYAGSLRVRGPREKIAQYEAMMTSQVYYRYFESNLLSHIKEDYPSHLMDEIPRCTKRNAPSKIGELVTQDSQWQKCIFDDEGRPDVSCGCVKSDGEKVAEGGWWVEGERRVACKGCRVQQTGCRTDLAELVSGGTIVMKCQFPTPVAVKCVDYRGNRVAAGAQWAYENVFYACDITADGDGKVKPTACATDSGSSLAPDPSLDPSISLINRCRHSLWPQLGYRYPCQTSQGPKHNGYEWEHGNAFTLRCEHKRNGNSLSISTRVTGCINDDGDRVKDGVEWIAKDLPFIRKCIVRDGDGSRKVSGCLDLNGLRVNDAAEWRTAEGKVIRACSIKGGQATVEAVGCVDEDQKRFPIGKEFTLFSKNLVVQCNVENGKQFHYDWKACLTKDGRRMHHGQTWQEVAFYVLGKPFLTKTFRCQASRASNTVGTFLQSCRFHDNGLVLRVGCMKTHDGQIYYCSNGANGNIFYSDAAWRSFRSQGLRAC